MIPTRPSLAAALLLLAGLLAVAGAVDSGRPLDSDGAWTGEARPQFTEGSQRAGGPFEPRDRPSIDGSPVDAVIVTTEAMAEVFQELADWHLKRGTRTVVRTLDWIGANYPPGRDRGENIRFFLQDAHQLWGLSTVILGGDTEDIPTRYAFTRASTPEGTTIPTDLYYSCLDGNWNADGDEHWAEAPFFNEPGDDADLEPELWIGRIPIGDPDSAADFLNKLFAYRETDRTDFQHRIAFFAEVLFPPDWSPGEEFWKDGAEYAVGVLDSLLNDEMEYEALFENWEHPIYVNVQPDPLNLSAAYDSMNSGNFAFVDQNGHGFRYNMSVGDGSILISHAQSLSNSMPFHLAMNNCTSAAYDFDCLAENFLRNPDGGAIAVFGTTRSSFPSTSYPFQVAYYRSLLREGKTRPGAAMHAMREDRILEAQIEGYDRWTYFIFTFLGDPLLDLWAGVPKHYELIAPNTTRIGAQSLNFWVRHYGEAVAGAQLTLYKEGEVWSTGFSDETGFCSLPARPQSEGVLTLTVWGPSAVMLHREILVQESERSFLHIADQILDDDPVHFPLNDGDGGFDAGEEIRLILSVGNQGGVAVPDVSVSLQSLSESLEVLTATENFGDISPGEVVHGAGELALRARLDAVDGSHASLAVMIEDGDAARADTISICMNAPRPILSEWSLNDDPPHGNGDGIFDESEPLRAFPRYVNLGGGATGELSASLVSMDVDLTVIEGETSIASIALLESGRPDPGFLLAMVDPAQVYFAEIAIEDPFGRRWTRLIEFHAPAPPTDLISDSSQAADEIVLSWHPSPSADVKGYHVYFAQDAPEDFQRYTLLPVEHAATVVEGLLENSLSFFTVTSVDESGMESIPSEIHETSTNPEQLAGFPHELQAPTSVTLAVGNVAGDARPELIAAADFVYAWHHDGVEVRDGDHSSATSGVFTENVAQITGALTLLPLLGNGYQQIVLGNNENIISEIRGIWVLDGAGDPIPGWPQATNDWFWANIVGADLDGDGDLEIAGVDRSGTVYAFHHDGSELVDGDGNPETTGVLHPDIGAWTIGSPAAADFDGDGAQELVLVGRDEMVHVLRADGSELPGFPVDLDPTGISEYYPNSPLVVANIDGSGDGSLEIIVQSEADSMFVFHDDGSLFEGYPRRLVSNNEFGTGPGPIPLDLDQDGDMELFIVETFGGGNSRLHLKNHDWSNRPGLWPVDIPANSQSSPLAGDVDGDGQIEFVLGTEQGIIYGFNLDGTPQAGFPIGVGGEVRGTPALADLDADGDVELLASTWNRRVMVWNFDGGFDQDDFPWPTISGNYHRTGRAGHHPAEALGEGADGQDEETGAQAEATVFRGAYPNPFNPSTVLAFETRRPGRLSLAIYTPAGRKVRSLFEGRLPAGEHERIWDGRGDGGQALASGVYLLRIAQSGRSEIARLVLLK